MKMLSTRVSALGLAVAMLWASANAVPLADTGSSIDERALGDIGERSEAHIHQQREAEPDVEEDLLSEDNDPEFSSDDDSDFYSDDDPDFYPDLDKRARGDINNPIPTDIDVMDWEDIAEQNCYVILCHYGGDLKWQRGPNSANAKRNRRLAGASLQPFLAVNLNRRGTAQISTDTTSAEEFPWASLEKGGDGAHVLPATLAQQNRQGRGIRSGYARAQVPYGGWMTLNFINYDPSKVFCPALFNAGGPDTSVCGKKKTTLFTVNNVDLSQYDFIKIAVSDPIKFRLA